MQFHIGALFILAVLLLHLLLLGGVLGAGRDKRVFFTNSEEMPYPRLGRSSSLTPLRSRYGKRAFYTSSEEVGIPRIGRSGNTPALQGKEARSEPDVDAMAKWPGKETAVPLLRLPSLLDFLALDRDGDGRLSSDEFISGAGVWVTAKDEDE